MAGKKRPSKTLKLTFADGELAGLVVRMRSPSLEVFLSFGDLKDLDTEDTDMDSIKQTLQPVADHLIEWNLEQNDDDPQPGKPIPATMSGLLQLGLEESLELMTAWMDGVASIPAPLDRLSKGGSSPLEASLPMEPLSASQVS